MPQTKPTGTQGSVQGLSGELLATAVEVPYAPGFNLEALREIDPDPMFATVAIRPGRGQQGRGYTYTADILRDLARQINERRAAGYRGHQDPDRVDWEWREPVTSWVGATYDEADQRLLVKGYVPPTAPELRTQIRLAEAGADTVDSVSVFGTREVDEKTNLVTKFDLWSIDWTPKGRAGMETELVSVGSEQAGAEEEEEPMTREEVIASLTLAEIPAALADALREEGREQVRQELAEPVGAIAEMRTALDLGAEAPVGELVQVVTDMHETSTRERHEERVRAAVEESTEITGELAQRAAISHLVLTVDPGASDEELAGEVAGAAELEFVAALNGSSGKVPVVVGGKTTDKAPRSHTSWEE